MLITLRFTLVANIIAVLIGSFLYWILPSIQTYKIIDITFLGGCCFWLASTVARLGSQRFKKGNSEKEVTLTDPGLVFRSNNLAFNLLIAGIPGILGSIFVGMLIY